MLKSLKFHKTVEIPLQRVNLIVGDNNTGKTTALQKVKTLVPVSCEIPIKIKESGIEYMDRIKDMIVKLHDSTPVLFDDAQNYCSLKSFNELFNFIIEFTKLKNNQIFIVTHNLEIIDSVLMAGDLENLGLVYFSQTENKTSQIKLIDGKLLYRLRYKRGLDIR